MSESTVAPQASPTPPSMPQARPNAFDPPRELGAWREEAPIRRMRYANGHLGWIATGYAAVRAVLSDPRFSNRSELNHPPLGPGEDPANNRTFPGFFLLADPPEHTRYRKLLTGQFTVRRMRQLEDGIREIVDRQLDAMAAAGPPAELVKDFAQAIPSQVICEMLGVPYAERAEFQRDLVFSLDESNKVAEAALDRTYDYLRDLVARKRHAPGDDMLSGLLEHPELSDDEIAGMGALLLIAGHDTTTNILGLGTFALLQRPDQLPALRGRFEENVADAPADEARVNAAVEELLRYLSVVYLTQRAALQDVEIEGQLIRAGETVTVSLAAGNRDPGRFEIPDVLDLTQGKPGHLAFGHGIHQCLGQQLARTEMRLAFPALFRRFPELRLAVSAEEVPLRHGMTIYGVHQLPVAW